MTHNKIDQAKADIDEAEVIKAAMECGFMISTMHGQEDVTQLMPVSDKATLLKFAEHLTKDLRAYVDDYDKLHKISIDVCERNLELSSVRIYLEQENKRLRDALENVLPYVEVHNHDSNEAYEIAQKALKIKTYGVSPAMPIVNKLQKALGGKE